MAKYTVKLARAPKGHAVPSLLVEVGAFVAKRPHGALGWFDAISAEPIPREWNAENADRLREAGFVFLHLPDGSALALLEGAVVLLGSEGEARTVANSLEEFLLRWAKGKTDIDELDDDDAAEGRKALGGWLAAARVKSPRKAKKLDFAAWLERPKQKASPTNKAGAKKNAAAKRASSPALSELGPKLRMLATVMGRRADDPELVTFVTKTLGKKVPATTNERNDSVDVEAPRFGVDLAFSHDVQNVDYPPVVKAGKSYVPYLCHAWILEELGEDVLGVAWDASLADVTKKLGPPTRMRRKRMTDAKPTVACWTRYLGAGVELEISYGKALEVELLVSTGRILERPASALAYVFLAWAIAEGLVDDAMFADRAALFAAVKKRKARASELGLPRGLWDAHLRDLPELRDAAYVWFHALGSNSIAKDLAAIFGKRRGPEGYAEPRLDDDAWPNVEKAAPAFGKQFGRWLAGG